MVMKNNSSLRGLFMLYVCHLTWREQMKLTIKTWRVYSIYYSTVTALVDKEKETDVMYRDFCKVFDTVSHNIPVSLHRRGMDLMDGPFNG